MKTRDVNLEIVEEYEILGEKRFRLRIIGTSIYLNISASSKEEALEKAKQMVKELELDKLVEVLDKETSA